MKPAGAVVIPFPGRRVRSAVVPALPAMSADSPLAQALNDPDVCQLAERLIAIRRVSPQVLNQVGVYLNGVITVLNAVAS